MEERAWPSDWERRAVDCSIWAAYVSKAAVVMVLSAALELWGERRVTPPARVERVVVKN